MEIAIIDVNGSVLFDKLIKPTISIPLDATAIHGISNEDVANAPSFADVLPDIQTILKNRKLVIYNANYDMRMFKQSARAHNLIFNYFYLYVTPVCEAFIYFFY